MAVNTQNTVAGTASGGSVITTQGNWFLEQLDALTNVAVGTLGSVGGAANASLDIYSSFRDRLKTLGLVKDEQAGVPQQSMPENLVTSASDYFSDPARVQNALLFAAAGSAVIAAVWYFVKKR